jgi:hypothetical protein
VKLIPNDITVSEQYAIRDHFSKMVKRWEHTRPSSAYVYEFLDQLVTESGVQCQMIGHHAGRINGGARLTGYDIVDEKKYAWFLLKWG